MADTTIKQIKVGTTTYDIGANMSLASSTGTSTITLSANSKYQISAGGNTIIFTTPADNNTATAADNILDGSNSGTQITYAPYSSTTATSTWVGTDGNAGKFYLGTVNPSKSTRLNYNGYLYATKLYSNNTEVSVVGHTHNYAGSSSAGGVANSAKEINMLFYKASEADGAAGYYKIATITHTNWSYCSFTMFATNSYAGDKFNTLFDVRCADNATTLNSFAFNIIGGTDISNKLKYLETKSGDNITKIEIFMLCGRHEHTKFYLVTSSTSAGLVLNTADWGATPDKASDTAMTGSATNTVKASALTVNGGSGTQPIYFKDGVPTATTYALNKTVPSDAVFTDTKNTAGTSNQTATKLFLVGATEQSANPQTHSNANVYIGTNNKLYSNAKEVVTTDDSRLSDARTPKSHSHTFSGSIANNVIGTYNSTTGELDLTVTTSTISGNTGN